MQWPAQIAAWGSTALLVGFGGEVVVLSGGLLCVAGLLLLAPPPLSHRGHWS